MSRPRHQRDWDDLAQLDAMWAVLSSPAKAHGNWDEAEFFRTGIEEIAEVRGVLTALGLAESPNSALEFGSGLGRLTVALRQFCREVIGVDISPAMIERAQSLHHGCQFLHNPHPDLRIFPSQRFDLIYSCRVLQHQPSSDAILRYVAEFVRVLKPGGIAAFQIPCHIPWRHRLQPRRRIYSVLRSVGLSPEFLYRWNFHPMRMTAVPEPDVCAAVEQAGGRILLVAPEYSCPPNESRFYYVAR